ncbi:MAG: UDP-N-acetylglucosamine 2-epimerase (non-hydrolyzing) [Saprospiraceae bacterium]|nr:UDP-N-acetylglucosamine 2-epimerase (non-hydrolyzing) [Candidatus Opimibacter skivensis]MBL0007477.1 UDP-N-acetylglucosamine 2-epimerase (non-hydrolyzing) [Candidatus Opimibacter skivensis]
MRIDIIAGARPNFMKIGPIIRQLKKFNDAHPAAPFQFRLIHTGQHYDRNMSDSFFEQLGIPEPDINLGAGSGTQASQTAQIMIGYEKAIQDWKPDTCIVVGDVTSTMACSIVAKKAGIKVAHVEAGIRSGDWSMPEEINRIVTDSITDYFFTTSEEANANLLKAGHRQEQIYYVGNTMIDSLLDNIDKLRKPDFFDTTLSGHPYIVLTLHRPSNVDDPEKLSTLLDRIHDALGDCRVLFPMHPRTRKIFDAIGREYKQFIIVEPMSYLEFMFVVKHATGVVTDSGGITEETTVLNIPCITLRDSTERPETIRLGTNELVADHSLIKGYIERMIAGDWKQAQPIQYWDGKTAERIVQALNNVRS